MSHGVERERRAGDPRGATSAPMRPSCATWGATPRWSWALALLLGARAVRRDSGTVFVDTSKSRALSAPVLQTALLDVSLRHAIGRAETLLRDDGGRNAADPAHRVSSPASSAWASAPSLAFVAATTGGTVDAVIRGIVDVGLTVPGLLVLIIIAVSIKKGLTVDQMAMVIASLAWLYADAHHPRPGPDASASAATSRWPACRA